jgi:hypothetical protein
MAEWIDRPTLIGQIRQIMNDRNTCRTHIIYNHVAKSQGLSQPIISQSRFNSLLESIQHEITGQIRHC